MYSIQAISGKGKGMVALVDIAKGIRILAEKPLFTGGNILDPQTMDDYIAEKIKALSKEDQRAFLEVHNNFPGKYPFSGITKTNALPLGGGAIMGGIFLECSRINHSCIPNSNRNWNEHMGRETIHAVCLIKAGEEITISYDRGGSREERHALLKTSFGFDCDCKLCSLSPAEVQCSDALRA